MNWKTRNEGFNRAKRCWRCPECLAQHMRKPASCRCGVTFKGKGKVDLLYFASLAESKRFIVLKELENLGVIRHLQMQVAFPLVVNGVDLGEWRCDSRYYHTGRQCDVIEDVKGGASGDSELAAFKRSLAEALHGIKVDIVLPRKVKGK